MNIKDLLKDINSKINELMNKKDNDLETFISNIKDIVSFVRPELEKHIDITKAEIKYNKDYIIESIYFPGGYDGEIYVKNDGIYFSEYTYANNVSPTICIYKFQN